jgi:ribosomal protein S18 acetylase RimI-like enzyme
MSSSPFGAKPAVLRCSRCGTFVDWADARAQVVCECRPRIELPPVLVREAADAERATALELFRRDFGRSGIVAYGQVIDLDAAPIIVADMNGEIAGALAYRLVDGGLHIVALATDPMWQRSGVGGHLVAEAELLARRLKIPRVIVSMTNDNLPSLYFYQRRGYHVSEWIPDGVSKHVKSTSLVGFGGIPIRDEVRLEKNFVAT